MKYKLHILIIFTFFISNISAYSYWHRVFETDANMTVNHQVLGDSSALYLPMRVQMDGMLLKSTDLGRTWDTIYDTWQQNAGNYDPPFRELKSAAFPAEGYMYLLYNYNGIGIKRFDTRINKVVDSIALTPNGGIRSGIAMYDSLRGALTGAGRLFITRDGWKSYKEFPYIYEVPNDSIVPRSDTTVYRNRFPYWLGGLTSIDSTTFRVGGQYMLDTITEQYILKMYLSENDTAFRFERLGEPLYYTVKNGRIFEDSTYWYRPRGTAYINDSLWIYGVNGKPLGGDRRTLEIYRTRDHRKTSERIFYCDSVGWGLRGCNFKDSLNGFVYGLDYVLITTDGGETWDFDNAYYDKRWEDKTDMLIAPRIWHVDGMTFLCTYGDGVYKYEEEFGASIKEEHNLQEIKIYPNPIHAGEKLNFELSQVLAGQAQIFNSQGMLMDSQYFVGNSIDVPDDIAVGAYFLVIESGGVVVAAEKFVVE